MFPDYLRLLPDRSTREVDVDGEHLRRQPPAATSATRDLVLLRARDDALEVAFDREFLLEAVAAMGTDQLSLALDGPLQPLAIRTAVRPDDVSLLMPTRLP